MEKRLIFELKTPRTGEETPEAMVQFLSSFTNLLTSRYYIFKRGIPFSLELATFDQSVHFYLTVPESYGPFAVSQMSSQYPKSSIVKLESDYLEEILKNRDGQVGQLLLRQKYLLPLKTYTEFSEVDPLSSLLGILSKTNKGENVVIQFLIVPTHVNWHGEGEGEIAKKIKKADGTEEANPYASVIQEKIKQHGFQVGIRLYVRSENPGLFKQVATTFSSFNNASGNSLHLKTPSMWQKSAFFEAMLARNSKYIPKKQILNLSEIATMYHLPGDNLSKLTNISWTKTILSEAPENLPVADGFEGEDRRMVNFFARTIYKNENKVFGIKKNDRRRHMYVIGKTGTGKSTLISNMVVNDMRNGGGMAVIDPHGDLVEGILDYVPKNRINDVIYLNPADTEATFRLNLLESTPEQKDLVASGIVAIFHKLYAESWGPRLEYILRNTILALLEIPDANLLMVPKMLADNKYRKKIVPTIKDPIIRSFWENEFNQMQPRQQSEAISPILNKVGQFLSSGKIRSIVGHSKSTVDLEDAMNKGKIVLFNLSQGKIGEDSAALLGAMTITKLQLSAMNRVNIPEEERRDFYLYVDEFQNFATNSFIKILSEARKYRLNLILANQYMAQLSPELKSAIFGNVGTLLSFIVGAEDMEYLAHEFGERFTTEDLLSLGNHQALMKLAIDGITTAPFHAYTLPPPKSINQNKEKVLKVSRERYGKTDDEPEMPTFSQVKRDEHRDFGDKNKNENRGGFMKKNIYNKPVQKKKTPDRDKNYVKSKDNQALEKLENEVAQLRRNDQKNNDEKWSRQSKKREFHGKPQHAKEQRQGPRQDRDRFKKEESQNQNMSKDDSKGGKRNFDGNKQYNEGKQNKNEENEKEKSMPSSLPKSGTLYSS